MKQGNVVMDGATLFLRFRFADMGATTFGGGTGFRAAQSGTTVFEQLFGSSALSLGARLLAASKPFGIQVFDMALSTTTSTSMKIQRLCFRNPHESL